MLALCNSASIGGAAELELDPRLRQLIALRVTQISQSNDCDIGDLAHFLVIQPGDTLAAILAALGFSPVVNFVDEARYGHPDFAPSWEWIERHDGWFELAYVLSDDGFGWIVFIQDIDGVEPSLLSLCRSYTK